MNEVVINWQPVVTALAGLIWAASILGFGLVLFVFVVSINETRAKKQQALDKKDTRI